MRYYLILTGKEAQGYLRIEGTYNPNSKPLYDKTLTELLQDGTLKELTKQQYIDHRPKYLQINPPASQ